MQLTRAQAQRIAVHAQLLDGTAGDLLATVRQLGFLQLDPIAHVERSHLLVLWSRLGRVDRAELDRLLWQERALVEWAAFIYPTDSLPALRTLMVRRPSFNDRRMDRWALDLIEEHREFRRYLLEELERRGPLLSRDLEDRIGRPQDPDRWWGPRRVTMMIELLAAMGDVAVVGRVKGHRLWDLADRWYPPTPRLSEQEAVAYLQEQRLRSLGIARTGPGERVTVEGVPGEWRIAPAALEWADVAVPERATLLSPFDRLVHDRDRAEDLWGFRYRIEIYTPAAKREYGYYVMPVLYGHELVGRIDPEHDRRARKLVVHRVYVQPGHELPPLDETLTSLADFVGAEGFEARAGVE